MNDVILNIYDRGADCYNDVAQLVPEVTDYFDFPATIITFGESLKTSQLCIANDVAFFRIRNKQLSLITYFCSGSELVDIISTLRDDGYKVKSLNYVNKDFVGLRVKSYGLEHMVQHDWSIANLIAVSTGNKRSHVRGVMNRCRERYIVSYASYVDYDDVMALFNQWVVEARDRHFMVVKGHYLQYIDYYFSTYNTNLLVYRLRDTGELWGICGYEVYNNQANIVLAKHLVGDSRFCKFMWMHALMHILECENISKIYCGTTADQLKRWLRMTAAKSYKVAL